MIKKSKEVNISPSSSNRILQGTSIDGNVSSEGDFRVDGQINGNINITGKLVIGEKGLVKGEVKCGSARISGRLEGTMIVEDLLNLEASARVEGDIFTIKLAIEPGAEFSGSCKMGAVVREIQNDGSTQKNNDDLKRSLKSYAKYSSLGFQMGALIFGGAHGGKWLDAEQGTDKPWFTMLGTLGGMALGLYLFLKGIKSDQDG